MLLLPVIVFGQSTVEGTVLDKVSKQPLPGVNVVIQGASNGTQTDFDGKFKLIKVKKGDKIVFSYVGYLNSAITYNDQSNLVVNLEEESNQLQEVVIQVGYGAAKKKDATGAVDLITAKEFNRGAIVSADQLLAGKAAGVRITTSGGQPDAAPNIRIRGGASLNASNSPLIIIDGVPLGDLNPTGVSNPFTLINPNDIESFSILKDASATAIYGVRASNGVILITTKKGTSGSAQFNYSSNVSVGILPRKLDVMNSREFVDFVKTYYPSRTNVLGIDDPNTAAVDDPLTEDVIEGRIIGDTDWQDVVTRTAISTDHNFSARANLYKKIPFRASVGYSKVQGLIRSSDLDRLTYSLKMTPKFLNDDLKIDLNAKGTYTDKNAIDDGGVFGGASRMDPTKPVYGSSFNNKFVGYYQHTVLANNRDEMRGAVNPLALLEQRDESQRAVRFLGNIEFDYKLPFLRDLRAVVNLGLDASVSKIRTIFDDNALATYRHNVVNPAIKDDPTLNYVFNPGLDYLENQTSTNKTMDAYLAYTKNLDGFLRKIDAQAGYSYQDFVTDGTKFQFRYNPQTGLREPNVQYPDQNPNGRYYSPLNLQAFFARANIDLMNKYLITATLRADGSSLFREEKRWGYFPAVGLAWKLKEESVLKNIEFVQDLKLRLGWGRTGQANIPGQFFPSRQLFTPGDATSQYLQGSTTYTPIPYNPDLTWETTTTWNVGLDFDLFKNNLITGSVDVFQRETTDLLALTPGAAGSIGGTEFLNNIGSIKGEGFELDLKFNVLKTDNASIEFGGNIGYSFYRVSQLDNITQLGAGTIPNGTGTKLFFNAVGQQAYSAWVFEQIYDSNGNPIVGAYVDNNQDGQITDADRIYKAIRPNWVYGFNCNFSYKNWDLAATFRGQLGGQIYNVNRLKYGALESALDQRDSSYLNNVLNFTSGAANPLFVNYNGNAALSDYLLEDATFLRCDNVSLSYKFNKVFKDSSLRVSGTVNNLFLITDYSGQDPETFNAFDENFYPRPMTFTLGLSLDF